VHVQIEDSIENTIDNKFMSANTPIFAGFLLLLIVAANNAFGYVIVRMEIQQGGIVENVDIKLLDDAAPLTVANFLNYVKDGDYINSFFHRSVPGFVVQAGGFIYDNELNDGAFSNDPSINDFPGGLQPVPEDPPVLNEFNKPNVRGTIAMAKIGGDPDSATSQWFFNLADNSSNLDTQNGGFTVFGEVLNGMSVVDNIAGQAIYDRTDIHFSFGELPLVQFVTDPVRENNLILVQEIKSLLSVTPDIDFGTVSVGSNLQPEVVIRNLSSETINIGAIASENPISAPFRIVSDECSFRALSPQERCSFIVLFTPENTDDFAESFDIKIDDPEISYEVAVTGSGGADTSEPDIAVTYSSIDYGSVDILYLDSALPYVKRQFISNGGELPLDLFAIDLSGPDKAEFKLTGDCLDRVSLGIGEFCTLDMEFTPLVPGEKISTLLISSNDPDESPFEMPVFAKAIPEDDGISAAIEDAGLNGGDGNNDGILDSQQSDVTSLVSLMGSYVTFLTSNGIRISNMLVLDQFEYGNPPDNVDLNAGVYVFDVGQSQLGSSIDIGMILPDNISPRAYYFYGPTQDNSSPHWYEFSSDGETGVTVIGEAAITSPTGKNITRKLVTIRVTDGGRGDTNLTADGKINLMVGVSLEPQADGGAVSIEYLMLILFVLMYGRSLKHDLQVIN
jgi:cyclophilin family peptidyl-prolyl cis-trans isomerase